MNLAKLGQRIRSQREKRHLTQAQLANSLHISAQAVSKWERGENAPDISILQPLSTLLDRSIEWVLCGNEEERSTFEATVFCTSLRGFAGKAASTSPENIALWINGLFHTMTEAVLADEGVPIKYTGDGFLAYFSGKDHAIRAIHAARACESSVSERDLLITIHSGKVYLGSIGHHEYASADIMGETVNTVFIMNRWATAHSTNRVIYSQSVADSIGETASTPFFTGDSPIPALFC